MTASVRLTLHGWPGRILLPMSKSSTRVVYAAIAANLAVAVGKFAVAAITGSAALLAEAFHSTADTGNEVLLLVGLKRSSHPADAEHPFGHGRELYFWAFVVAISIFAVGGGLSIYTGIERTLHPEPLGDPFWDYLVLGIAVLFEGYSWRVSWKELKRRQSPGESLVQIIHTSKDPTVFTIFVEDTAALIGLAIAFLGVFFAHQFGKPVLDSAASILIGVLLVLAAAALATETGGLLLGEGVDPKTMKSLCAIIAGDPAVQSVGKTLTMQLGPDDVLLVADVAFRSDLGTRELEQAVDRIEESVQRKHPAIRRLYFEAEGLSGKADPNRRVA